MNADDRLSLSRFFIPYHLSYEHQKPTTAIRDAKLPDCRVLIGVDEHATQVSRELLS